MPSQILAALQSKANEEHRSLPQQATHLLAQVLQRNASPSQLRRATLAEIETEPMLLRNRSGRPDFGRTFKLDRVRSTKGTTG